MWSARRRGERRRCVRECKGGRGVQRVRARGAISDGGLTWDAVAHQELSSLVRKVVAVVPQHVVRLSAKARPGSGSAKVGEGQHEGVGCIDKHAREVRNHRQRAAACGNGFLLRWRHPPDTRQELAEQDLRNLRPPKRQDLNRTDMEHARDLLRRRILCVAQGRVRPTVVSRTSGKARRRTGWEAGYLNAATEKELLAVH